MRVAILTIGTRGDLELFLGLGQALRNRGADVVVGTSTFYADSVRASGLEWSQVGRGSFDQLRARLEAMGEIQDLVARTKAFYRGWIKPELKDIEAELPSLAGGADLFISNLKLTVNKGKERLPSVFVDYDPPIDLKAFARLGIESAVHRSTTLDLVAMSQLLVDPQGTWPQQYRFTGFWRGPVPSEPWRPCDRLAQFIESGAPPVAVTLGSMATFDAQRFVEILRVGLKRSGRRAVLVCGWSNLSSGEPMADRDIYVISQVPYDWLFPRAACVIHHGGTGTVASVLRAGRASVVVPQIACQAIYARILETLNLSTATLALDSLQSEKLAEAITAAAEDHHVKETAAIWQQKIQTEAGLETAVDLIERHHQDCQRGERS